MIRCVLLGLPTLARSWKVDVAEAAVKLGWSLTHLPARGLTTDQIIQECRGADLLLWARTPGHDPTGDVDGMLGRIADAGTVTAGLHLDLYWGIPYRQREIGRAPWWRCRHVFTADGGDRPWQTRGVNHRWLTPPLGRRYLGRRPSSGRYPHRIVFVGSYGPAVHGPHRHRLITWAQRTYRSDFARYGGAAPKVRGQHLGDLYNSAEVVLGDSAPAPRYWSDRIPCTLGRGGLLAHPHTYGLAEHGFTEDVMLLYERGRFDALGQQIATLTAARRREMTDAAITLIAERHLWEHRLADIQQEVGLT